MYFGDNYNPGLYIGGLWTNSKEARPVASHAKARPVRFPLAEIPQAV